MPADYLDHLAAVLHCACLSDLRYRTITAREAKLLLGESEDYPPAQYLDAARYILAREISPHMTVAESKKAVVAHMS